MALPASRRRLRTAANPGGPGYGPSNIPEPGVPERGEWPFPSFIARTLAKFPDAGVCSVEEARALNEEARLCHYLSVLLHSPPVTPLTPLTPCQDGYTFLDVRSKTEFEYKIAFSVNIPLIHAVFKFDPETKKKVPHQSVNASFVKEVEAKFAKDAKLIVTCSAAPRAGDRHLQDEDALVSSAGSG